LSPAAILLVRLSLVIVPLAALAYFKRIYPHRPLVILALVPGMFSVGLIGSPGALSALLVIDIAVALVAAVDLVTLPGARTLSAERQAGRTASLERPHTVTLSVINRARRSYFLSMRDGVPEDLDVQPDELRALVDPHSQWSADYQLTARRRGAFHLEEVFLRVRSRFGLWQRMLTCAVETEIHVYPDIEQLGQYAALARTNRLRLLGVHASRRVGQDNEFERLRDYSLDDNYKHIDWRSTARRAKLTVKQFQQNQSQRIVFLLDAGRMMTNETAGLSLLDHALNAALLLSYVAISHGDAVGLLCFSDEVHRFVSPAGGRRQMNRLLHAVFDQFPRRVESRYDRAFLHLSSNCRKRCLVILITNIIDEVNSRQVYDYLGTIIGRHLPLAVWLRERSLFAAADEANPRGKALFHAAAAADILLWRRGVLADLQARGVMALDVFPEELTAPLVNRYLEIKARHLL